MNKETHRDIMVRSSLRNKTEKHRRNKENAVLN